MTQQQDVYGVAPDTSCSGRIDTGRKKEEAGAACFVLLAIKDTLLALWGVCVCGDGARFWLSPVNDKKKK
jgi:hypothetical protein